MARPDFELESTLERWRRRLSQNQGLPAASIDELEDHLRELFAEEMEQSDSEVEAFRRAVGRLGQAPLLEEAFRTERGVPVPVLTSLRRQIPGLPEFRYGARRLALHWSFSLSAILILALAIGANTAIFTVVNSVLLRPLPFLNPQQLVRVWTASPDSDREVGAFSFPDLQDWAERSTTMAQWGLYTTLISDLVWTGEGEARELQTAYVTPGFFRTLGVTPLLGSGLLADREDAEDLRVVISHDLWRSEFGADRAVVGRKLALNHSLYEIAGVMPRDFQFPGPDIQIWCYLGRIAQSSTPWKLRPVRFLEALGRLREGVTKAQAEQELGEIAGRLATEYPETNATLTGARLEPLQDVILGNPVRQSLAVLLAAVALILLIACANVANLFLARSLTRRRELAVRLALGASRSRLVGQLLVESLLLAAVAGLLGVLLAYLGVRLLVAEAAPFLPRAGEIRPDAAVLGFNLGISLLTGILFGLLPAFTASATSPNEGLHGGGRGDTGSREWARSGLVVAEVGLAIVLLVAAGLLLNSAWQRLQVDPGFEAEGLLTATLTISPGSYPERPRYLALYRAALERLGAHPEVLSAGSLRYFPTLGVGEQVRWDAVGDETPPGGAERTAFLLQASPGIFETLRTPVLSGRPLLATDTGDSPTVIVINRTLAQMAFSTDRAAGRFLRIAENTVEIAGVVGDIRQASLEEPAVPTIYIAQEQSPRRGMTFVLRGRSGVDRLIPVVRRIFHDLDPDQAISQIAPALAVLRGSIHLPRFLAALLASFALLAALLAGLGVYSLIAYSISRRSREIGIRMALGANHWRTRRMVIAEGMRPVLLGGFLGLVTALAASRLLAGLLFGISSSDPATYLGVSLLILLMAVPGCLIPAYRATRIDPVNALRQE